MLRLLLLKSQPEFHLHIIRIDRSEITATRSYIANNLKLWVGYQSQKRGCSCSTNSDKRVRRFGAACDHMIKYYKR